MTDLSERQVESIPIERINVLNPRERARAQHQEITENIAGIGLKRPITVSRRTKSDPQTYDLVCGQGRVEAFQALGETLIPALVIDVAEDDCLVRSLVENIARRRHRPLDLMQGVSNLHKKGYSDGQIAAKIGVTRSWAATIVNLLERGEERLISAVEAGLIPLSFASDIARATDAESQNLLMNAYASGVIKGKKIALVRRLLERRQKRRGSGDLGGDCGSASFKTAPPDLTKLFKQEVEKQRLLIKRSNYAQSKLLFIVEALKDLLGDGDFAMLLHREHFDSVPSALVARIEGRHCDDRP